MAIFYLNVEEINCNTYISLTNSTNVDRTITSVTTFFRLELCTVTTDFQVLVAYLFFYRESFCFCLPSLSFLFILSILPIDFRLFLSLVLPFYFINPTDRFPTVSIFGPTLFRTYFLLVSVSRFFLSFFNFPSNFLNSLILNFLILFNFFNFLCIFQTLTAESRRHQNFR